MDYGQIIVSRLEEGTLIRKKWTGEKGGKDLACLLAAIVSECGELKGAGYCPAEVMPAWLAHLTPWIDDAGTEEKWEGFVRRFAATSSRWGKLTQRHEYAVRALIVREAVTHTSNSEVIAVCNRVIELCDFVAAGGEIDKKAFSAAEAAARATAAAAAAWAAARATAAAWAAARATAAASSAADRIIDGILCVLESA